MEKVKGKENEGKGEKKLLQYFSLHTFSVYNTK